MARSIRWSIEELWDPKGGTATEQDAINGKIVAAIIVLWSLVWPHVKLMLLQVGGNCVAASV